MNEAPSSVSRHNLPPLAELAAICGGEGRGAGEPRDLRRLYARLVRRLSIRITRLLLPTGISANQATVLGIFVGLAGAVLLAFNDYWAQIGGLALLQLSFVLDFCDGEIARFEREVEGKTSGAGGAYLDWVGHYYLPAAITAAVGWAVFDRTGDAWVWVAVLVIVLSLVRVPYSARDHIMWGVYRDRPELRDDPAMVRAALARMGGDPSRIDLAADHEQRMAGVSGSGLLWSRYTNLGQLIVFPGFINLVAAAAVVDMLISNDYPVVDSVTARAILLALLGVVHLLHQGRAVWQSFRVTRALE
jgi:phosphatidylglycerophosphate synthase